MIAWKIFVREATISIRVRQIKVREKHAERQVRPRRALHSGLAGGKGIELWSFSQGSGLARRGASSGAQEFDHRCDGSVDAIGNPVGQGRECPRHDGIKRLRHLHSLDAPMQTFDVFQLQLTRGMLHEDGALELYESDGDFQASLPGWAARFAEDGCASTRPERDGGDAFFAAAMQRALK